MNANNLEQYQDRNDFRMEALLALANFFVGQIAPDQPSERVSRQLTERNVRYYIHQEIVDRPAGKDGLSALYGYRHLLQLIALKRLQALYLPVKKIAELIAEKTDAELQALAVGKQPEISEASGRAALFFLNAISGPQAVETQQYGSGDGLPAMPVAAPDARFGVSPQPSSWKRYELADGIEIHIRSDRKRPIAKSKIQKAIDEFLKSF